MIILKVYHHIPDLFLSPRGYKNNKIWYIEIWKVTEGCLEKHYKKVIEFGDT